MSILNDVIDHAKYRLRLRYDTELAEIFKVSSTTIANWRFDRASPTDDIVEKLASITEQDTIQLLARVNIERWTRADRPNMVAAWKKILKKSVAAVFAVVTVGFMAIGPSQNDSPADFSTGGYIPYANWGRKWLRRAIFAFWPPAID